VLRSVVVIEAKKGDLEKGFNQLAAEMNSVLCNRLDLKTIN